mmetsp:Transcript_56544/g.148724  ORF Transcript_56544/g.148724 Transcript_56544/m.148724 type:complete len:219 (-) Transcript_56544:9-665(-)
MRSRLPTPPFLVRRGQKAGLHLREGAAVLQRRRQPGPMSGPRLRHRGVPRPGLGPGADEVLLPQAPVRGPAQVRRPRQACPRLPRGPCRGQRHQARVRVHRQVGAARRRRGGPPRQEQPGVGALCVRGHEALARLALGTADAVQQFSRCLDALGGSNGRSDLASFSGPSLWASRARAAARPSAPGGCARRALYSRTSWAPDRGSARQATTASTASPTN